jgi:hypothetical protein
VPRNVSLIKRQRLRSESGLASTKEGRASIRPRAVRSSSRLFRARRRV